EDLHQLRHHFIVALRHVPLVPPEKLAEFFAILVLLGLFQRLLQLLLHLLVLLSIRLHEGIDLVPLLGGEIGLPEAAPEVEPGTATVAATTFTAATLSASLAAPLLHLGQAAALLLGEQLMQFGLEGLVNLGNFRSECANGRLAFFAILVL